MNGLLALCLSHWGLSALCLAMPRHHEQVLHTKPHRAQQRRLRTCGWLMLLGALTLCATHWGLSVGLAVGSGLLGLSASLIAFLLPYRPRIAVSPALPLAGLLGRLLPQPVPPENPP